MDIELSSDYFQQALSFFSALEIPVINLVAEKKRFRFRKNRGYSMTQIKRLFQSQKKLTFHCKGSRIKPEATVLIGIDFCYDPNTHAEVDCITYSSSCASDDIYFVTVSREY